MATQQEMIDAVKAYALTNYERDGWDMIVECYEDSEIAEEIVGCESIEDAIAEVGKTAALYDEQRTAVLNEIF